MSNSGNENIKISNETNDEQSRKIYEGKKGANNCLMLQFVPGAISGPISRTLTAPLDRIKLHIQVSAKKETILISLKNLIKADGILGLWRGNGINVIKIAPEMALRFGIYEKIKEIFFPSNLSTGERFVSGALAGMISQTVMYPMDLFKTKMMLRTSKDTSGVLVSIYRAGGLKAFYRGYVTSIIGIIPYMGVDLAAYETLKNHFALDKTVSAWKVMLCGSLSITLGQFCSYPLYLIKARLQAESDHPSMKAVGKKMKYSIFYICYSIISTEGILGLYRGMIPTLFKVLPAGAINYAVYEYAYRHIYEATL